MKRKSLWRISLIAGAMPFLLSACQIFPEEVEVVPAPVLQSYEVKEYKQTVVLRGEMKLEKMISCEYAPTKKELLGFARGGEYIDQIYVTEGQEVKAGDLLAQLVLEDLDQKIAQKEYEVRVLKLKRAHAQEDWAVKAQQYEIRNDLEGKIKAEADYREQLQGLDDSIYIENLKLADLKEELAHRQIFAGIDGAVTYVKDVESGDRSEEGVSIIIISDMSTASFSVKSKDAEYFPIGTEVTIHAGKKEYKAVAVEPEELGITVEDSEDTPVYLKMEQPDPTLEDGDRGKIYVTLDYREDTLYVYKKAIRTMDGKNFVYMLNDEGLRVSRDVTIGLESGDYIEITSGLEAGDSVIVE